MFCKTCKDKKLCKKICPELEKHLQKECGLKEIRTLTSCFKDNAEVATTYDWAGGQDRDFIDANLGWD